MKVFKHGYSSVYVLNKKVQIFKINDNKLKFFFCGKDSRGKLWFKIANWKFNVSNSTPATLKYLHVLIRTPFFYFERHNGANIIGIPNFYMRFTRGKL